MDTAKQSGIIKNIPDSFQSFLVHDAYFTDEEEYPIIPANFVSCDIPKKILPFKQGHYVPR